MDLEYNFNYNKNNCLYLYKICIILIWQKIIIIKKRMKNEKNVYRNTFSLYNIEQKEIFVYILYSVLPIGH